MSFVWISLISVYYLWEQPLHCFYMANSGRSCSQPNTLPGLFWGSSLGSGHWRSPWRSLTHTRATSNSRTYNRYTPHTHTHTQQDLNLNVLWNIIVICLEKFHLDWHIFNTEGSVTWTAHQISSTTNSKDRTQLKLKWIMGLVGKLPWYE